MLPMQRPAETGGVVGGAAVIIARAFGENDPNVLAGIGVVAGFLPAVITWIVVQFRRARAGVGSGGTAAK